MDSNIRCCGGGGGGGGDVFQLFADEDILNMFYRVNSLCVYVIAQKNSFSRCRFQINAFWS